jgi:hypothetical protein
MNRTQYIGALMFCFQAETAGAIAGEVAMLLRSDVEERRKLDIFRRIEASNKLLCLQGLQREGIAQPTVDRAFYRLGYQLGLRLGEGDWDAFLDRFQATIHPEIFEQHLAQASGMADASAYPGVNAALLQHLVRHEYALMNFVARERAGRSADSTIEMESALNGELCGGLVGPDDPVGW